MESGVEIALRLQVTAGQEPVRSNTIVEIHHYKVSAGSFDKASTIVVRVVVLYVASTLDPKHYWQTITIAAGGIGWSVNIDEKAVFCVF